MARSGGIGSTAAALAAGLLLLLVAAGCASSAGAALTASSLVRARPTTAPETYKLQMDGAVHTLQDALGRLSALLADPHYFYDAWKSDVIDQSTLVERGYRQLEGLTPPGREQARHAQVLRAVQDCQTLTVYVFQGINNLDKSPFDEVTKRVGSCRTALDLATGAVRSLAAPSLPASFGTPHPEVHVRTKRDANLRGGPSTSYPVVAGVKEGDRFTVLGRTTKGDWLQVTGEKVQNAWIAVFLVQPDGDPNSVSVITQANP